VQSLGCVHELTHAPAEHALYGAQLRAAWGAPVATLLHVPSLPATSHALHGPVHALSQQ